MKHQHRTQTEQKPQNGEDLDQNYFRMKISTNHIFSVIFNEKEINSDSQLNKELVSNCV